MNRISTAIKKISTCIVLAAKRVTISSFHFVNIYKYEHEFDKAKLILEMELKAIFFTFMTHPAITTTDVLV